MKKWMDKQMWGQILYFVWTFKSIRQPLSGWSPFYFPLQTFPSSFEQFPLSSIRKRKICLATTGFPQAAFCQCQSVSTTKWVRGEGPPHPSRATNNSLLITSPRKKMASLSSFCFFLCLSQDVNTEIGKRIGKKSAPSQKPVKGWWHNRIHLPVQYLEIVVSQA